MSSTPASVGLSRPSLASRLPEPIWCWSVMAGVATGVVYSLSPLTVLLAIVIAPVLHWAVRNLEGFERRAVVVLLAVAIALRVLAVLVLCVTADPNVASFATFFGDEEFYLVRGLRLYSMQMGLPISTESFLYAYDKTGYTAWQDAIVLVQVLVGPAPYGIHLLNAALFLCGTVLLFRVVRASFGPAAALVGLVYQLFLPSLFMWSVSGLKESLYLLLTAVVLVNGVTAVRGRSLAIKLTAASVALGLGLWLETLRAASRLITLGGTLLAYVLRLVSLSRRAIWAACAVTVIVIALAWQRGLPERVQDQLQQSARYHRGHVFTPGHSYKLLDQRFYSTAWTPLAFPQLTPVETGRFVVRAALHFIVEPIPWRAESRLELAYMPELLIWYLSVLLVPLGLAAGFRRDPLLTCMLAGYSFMTAGVIALNSGNVGTLVRHRALMAPCLGWISALGLVSWFGVVLRRAEKDTRS